MSFADLLRSRMEQLERDGLLRRTTVSGGVGGKLRFHPTSANGGQMWGPEEGHCLLNFSSNDYLNLAQDSRVKRRAQEAVDRWGCGATASRLMCGTLPPHEELEAALARLTGHETALVFSSGFGMNVGVLAALAGRDDVIFADRLSHASLIDGARLSGAALKRFAHNDVRSLEHWLRTTPCRGHRLIVCESVYSMDGDVAPLQELRRLATKYEALLLVDEAHAIGVWGEGGGLGLECRKVRPGPDCDSPDCDSHDAAAELTVGTLGKALGSLGGFVACTRQMREYLVNCARSFIYATALPPASVAAPLGAIEAIEGDPGMGVRLLERARAFHRALRAEGLEMPEFGSQILPVLVGENRRALELASTLRERGLLVTAVRPPTVPEGTARLRLSVTLAHTTEDLSWAAAEIGSVARCVGVR
jgi:8-amino-7-oxononanoate synthase